MGAPQEDCKCDGVMSIGAEPMHRGILLEASIQHDRKDPNTNVRHGIRNWLPSANLRRQR